MVMILLKSIEILMLISMITAKIFTDEFASAYCHSIKDNENKSFFKEFVSFGSKLTGDNMKQFNNSKMTDCFTKCQNSTVYYAAEIDEDTGLCKLYGRNYTIKTAIDSKSKVYKWKPCNMSEGIDNPSRCTGNWVYEKDYIIKKGVYKYYHNTFNTSDITKCMKNCIGNRVCGGFNFYLGTANNNKCDFMKYYKSNEVELQEKKGWYNFQWLCTDKQNINLEKGCSNFNKGCVGRFILKKSVNKTLNTKYLILNYKTRDYRDCIINCEQLYMCEFILYSFLEAHCYLLSNTYKQCATKFTLNNTVNYQLIEWECCPQQQPTLIRVQEFMPTINQRCLCLKPSGIHLFRIKQLNCNTNFEQKTLPLNSSRCVDAKLNCTANQCFLWLKNWTIPHSYGVVHSFLVYTGYEEYIIQFTENKNTKFSTVFYEQPYQGICEYYSAKLVHSSLDRIISRKQWNAEDDIYHAKKLIPKIAKKYLVIGYVPTKWCPCSTEQSCEYQVIVKQAYSLGNYGKCDLPFNFMVTQSGDVFEGLGFYRQLRSQCQYSVWRQEPSEYLYIGVFAHLTANFPSLKSLNSVKKLINKAVEMGFLSYNYTLYGSDFYRPSGYKRGKKLFDIIRLWKQYNSRIKIPCQTLTRDIILMNCISVIIMVVLLTLGIKNYHRFMHSSMCQRIVKLLESNSSSAYTSCFCIDDKLQFEHKGYLFDLGSINVGGGECIKIDLHNTTCFWLCDKQELKWFVGARDHTFSCKKLLENFLQLCVSRPDPIPISQLRILLSQRFCSDTYVTHFLYTPSRDILQKNMLIICHLQCVGSVEMVKKSLALIINNYQLAKCFCKNVDIECLKFNSTPTQIVSRFHANISRNKPPGIRKDKINGENYWFTFSSLRYSMN